MHLQTYRWTPDQATLTALTVYCTCNCLPNIVYSCLTAYLEERQIFEYILWPHHSQIHQETSELSGQEDLWHTLLKPSEQQNSNITTSFNNNRVFPSYINTRFQNEAKCKTSLVKMSSMCMRIKIIFILIDGFTLSWSLWNRGLRQLRNGSLLLD